MFPHTDCIDMQIPPTDPTDRGLYIPPRIDIGLGFIIADEPFFMPR